MNGDKAVWIKASKSDATGNCVEMCGLHHTVLVRDSKNASTGVLKLGSAGFAAWLSAAKDGEFDRLLGS
ncbi:hypothetical protein Kisp01_67370 [Kineosporia sp. NBRC 101677]|uniref:DUF397 domain-containing protein n=1 Tax=Kineosporia sp. NBRC 101677 TaxID=3032197 RepID=UPI0024A261B0|nr:DUF397 domain-containing protein [Kineosporia sp. NBRC 101677]GLY19723.1 hypothetical protein Kisp01_67370 [Kineosporia sp. NBRC 101677]